MGAERSGADRSECARARGRVWHFFLAAVPWHTHTHAHMHTRPARGGGRARTCSDFTGLDEGNETTRPWQRVQSRSRPERASVSDLMASGTALFVRMELRDQENKYIYIYSPGVTV